MRLYSFAGSSSRAAEAALRRIEQRRIAPDLSIERNVRRILDRVGKDGDKAVRGFAQRFDGLAADLPLRVSEEELTAAWKAISAAERGALRLAADRIAHFARAQMPKSWLRTDKAGMTIGQRVVPLESVACYVPSGTHPLPSSLLMTAVPAQIAGVQRIAVFCSKPTAMVLAAANMLRIAEVYRVGGAHAIAAAGYGTASIAAVAKIAGPGSAFVTIAKQLVAADATCRCTIDMPAGPTETVVCSNAGSIKTIVADLVAQAEHSADTLAVFVTMKAGLAQQMQRAVKLYGTSHPVAATSLRQRGAIFMAENVARQWEIVNRIAPEHLTIDDMPDLAFVKNAGSVFVGTATPQALGDYISGPNHTLPTAGFARLRGGLSVMDFCKVITVQSASPAALRKLCAPAAELARAEGLLAHEASLRLAESLA